MTIGLPFKLSGSTLGVLIHQTQQQAHQYYHLGTGLDNVKWWHLVGLVSVCCPLLSHVNVTPVQLVTIIVQLTNLQKLLRHRSDNNIGTYYA